MKNKEKYDLRKFSVVIVNGTIKIIGDDFEKTFEGYGAFANWLEEEYKELNLLTDAEYAILLSVKGYRWIARDENGDLFLYLNEPTKDEEENMWMEFNCNDFKCYNHLFEFVSWKDNRAHYIDRLLKDYVWQECKI